MSYFHSPSDEALQAFDALSLTFAKGQDEDLYVCARETVIAFGPFAGISKWQRHLDAALVIVATTNEPWDAVLRAAAILRGW